MKLKFLLTNFILLIFCFNSKSQWVDINSSRCDIGFINDSTGWIVGQYGLIIQTTDGGQTWNSIFNTGVDGNFNFQHIFIIDKKLVFLTTGNPNSYFYGKGTYRTINGGKTWEIFEPITNGYRIKNLIFMSDSLGWAYGKNSSNEEKFFKTTNLGASWVEETLLLDDICKKGDKVFGINYSGTYLYKNSSWTKISTNAGYEINFVDSLKGYSKAEFNNYLSETTDGGITWNRLPLQLGILDAMCFVDKNTYWKVYDTKIYKSTDGGKNWICKFTMPRGGVKIYVRNQDIYVLGYESGLTVKSSDGGENWVVINNEFPNMKNLYKIQFIDNNLGWIGDYSIIFKTKDGGQKWQSFDTNNQLFDFNFFSEKIGCAVCYTFSGCTRDSGKTWTNYDMQSNGSDAVYILDTTHVLVYHNYKVYLTDLKLSVSSSNYYDIGYGYKMDRFYFIDNLRGWGIGLPQFGFGGYNYIYTSNGGLSWTKYTGKFDVHFFNINNGCILNNNKLSIVDYNLNVSFSKDLSAYGDFNKVFMVDDKIIWVAGELGNMIHTEDGGQNWIIDQTSTQNFQKYTSLNFRIESDGHVAGFALAGSRLYKYTGSCISNYRNPKLNFLGTFEYPDKISLNWDDVSNIASKIQICRYDDKTSKYEIIADNISGDHKTYLDTKIILVKEYKYKLKIYLTLDHFIESNEISVKTFKPTSVNFAEKGFQEEPLKIYQKSNQLIIETEDSEKASNLHSKFHIYIFDDQGRLLLSKECLNELDITSFKNGIYLIQLFDGKSYLNRKIPIFN